MKLKNILLAFSALLAFASCSKSDDVPIADNGKDGRLSIKVVATGGVATRAADEYELPGEAAINNLTAVVFNENGSQILGSKWQSTAGSEGSAVITDVEMKTGNVQIAVVANAPEGTFEGINSYTEFENKVVELSSQSQANLTMSSRLISVMLTNTDDNYIGYGSTQSNVGGLNDPILLTRVAARIDLVSVRTNFAGSNLEGRTVKVNSVYLSNAKTASRYFSPADWGIVEIPGNMTDKLAEAAINKKVNATTSLTDTPYRAYTMENGASEAATQLMIDATLTNDANYFFDRKIFAVTINKNGLDNNYNHNYIKRNYVYELGITFGKNSFDETEGEPDPIPPIVVNRLDVSITIANWGEVYQDVTYD